MIYKHCRIKSIVWFTLMAVACATTGCRPVKTSANRESISQPRPEIASTIERELGAPDPCRLVLVPHAGTSRLDLEIQGVQARLQKDVNPGDLEKLGWLFVTKARASFDPGYYKLAEQCAFCLETHQPKAMAALLLRGHVLQSLHRFKEAEVLARELVVRRGLSFDYGLLGDTLMEQGQLGEAAAAYQTMVDQKPDLQAYARISYLRWLKGDLAGATEVMRMAVSAASPNAKESAAWVNTRLGLLQFQNGKLREARQSCEAALEYQPDYAPALLLQGRLLLAEGKPAEAVPLLRKATKLNPLPEYQWATAEALRAAGQPEEAVAFEARLRREGAAADPRTFALYLASLRESPATALELARSELSTRQDVFTHDALAWALAANGRIADARNEMAQALAEGTKDARLFFHAAVIAAMAGDTAAARLSLDQAIPFVQQLLPSEQKQLRRTASEIGTVELGKAEPTSGVATVFTHSN